MFYHPLVAHTNHNTYDTYEGSHIGNLYLLSHQCRQCDGMILSQWCLLDERQALHVSGYNTAISSGVCSQSGDAVEICRSDPETDDGLQGGTDAHSVSSVHCRPLSFTDLFLGVLSAGFL